MNYYQQQEELQDMFYMGDAVRCHKHGEVIRSADGMYDAPCCGCEWEMDQEYFDQEEREAEEALQEMVIYLDFNPDYDMVTA